MFCHMFVMILSIFKKLTTLSTLYQIFVKLITNFFDFLKTRVGSFHFFDLPKFIRSWCLRCFIWFRITLIRIKKSLRIRRLRVRIIWYTSFWSLIIRGFLCLIGCGHRRWIIIGVTILWSIKSRIWVTYIISIFVTSWTYHSVVPRLSIIISIHRITQIHWSWIHVIRLYSFMTISIFLFRFLRRWWLTLLLIINLYPFWSFHFCWLISFKSKVKVAFFIIKPTFLMYFFNFLQVLLRKSSVKIEFVLSNDFLPKDI